MDGDGEADPVCGGSQREEKGSYKDLNMDVEDLEEPDSDYKGCRTKRPYKEPEGLLNKKWEQSGNSGAESSGFLSAYPVCDPQDRWEERRDKDIQYKLLHSYCTAEDSIYQANPRSTLERCVHNMGIITPPATPGSRMPRPFIPVPSSVTAIAATVSSVVNPMVSNPMTDTSSPSSSMSSPTSSAWETLRSTSRSPGYSDQDPVSAAAHLHLLGESLSLIGHHLQETDKMVSMSSSLSLLLDSLLCALAPLLCLTAQIPELRSCTQHTLASTLENISYVMPGL